MILIILLFLLCYFCMFFSKRKSVFYPTPKYPGCIPLLGHILLLPRDATDAVRMMIDITKESFKLQDNIIFTFGTRDVLIITDPYDSAKLLNSNAEKSIIYDFAKPWIGNGLVTAPNALWNQHRKIMYPMFSQQVLNGYMKVFNCQARRLVEHFATQVGKGPFNHRPFLVLMGLEAVCQTALGLNLSEQNQSDIKEYAKAIDGVMDGFVQRFQSIPMHINLLYQMSSLKKNVDRHLNIVHRMSEKIIEKNETKPTYSLNSDTEYKTLIEHLIQALKENNISREQVREQLDTIVATGYDTSAHELLYALMLLGTHQDVQEKAYKEIQEVLENSDRDVDRHDLSKLVYIEAVLKETLRLYPVTPIVARTTVEEVQLKKCKVPPGQHCAVFLYAVNRHPVWGDDVDQFRPERWLDPSKVPTHAFAPFSLGKRSCVGKVYAMMSMKTSLAHVLRQYRVTADISKVVLKIDPVLRPASGQHLILELRK